LANFHNKIFDQLYSVFSVRYFGVKLQPPISSPLLGRGALANAGLAFEISRYLGITDKAQSFKATLPEWADLLCVFADLAMSYESEKSYAADRLKQWMKQINQRQPLPWFNAIKVLQTPNEIMTTMRSFVESPRPAQAV
jgi:tRNA-dihydrouridine synthase